jgi:hypothetical protein
MTEPADYRSTAKGGPLRRAWVAAWIVTVAMGATTMTFQAYHSIVRGQMPWPLAVLYGVVPLLLSMCVLEIVAEWRNAPPFAKFSAFAIMGAAMFLSASATGAVVLHAAPHDAQLVFGGLMDAAELLAVYFILNVPRAADLAATAEAAEAKAREAQLRDELAAATQWRRDAEAALGVAQAAVEASQAEAAAATARAEVLAAKLAGSGTRKRGAATGGRNTRKAAGSATRKLAVVTALNGSATTGAADPDALVLQYVREGLSASEAGRKAGLSDSRGRQIVREHNAASQAASQGGQP